MGRIGDDLDYGLPFLNSRSVGCKVAADRSGNAREEFGAGYSGDNGEGLGDISRLNTEFDLSGCFGRDGKGSEHPGKFLAGGRVVEIREAEGGAAADHGGGIPEHGKQGLMEGGIGRIFSHEPGDAPADIRIRMFCERENARVVTAHSLVIAAHFFAHLQ